MGHLGTASPPPAIGVLLMENTPAHEAQNVHSKEQMRTFAESVENPLSQHSQPNLSSSMTDHLSIKTRTKSELSFDLALCPDLITSYTQIGGNHLGNKRDEIKTKSLRRKLQAASR